MAELPFPDRAAIASARERLKPWIRPTPTLSIAGGPIHAEVPGVDRLVAKFELWQHTGSFKPRGALLVLMGLSREQLDRGVVAYSAGNHALALSWAAASRQTRSTLVMPETADPSRIARVRALGGTVELVADVRAAKLRVDELVRSDHLTFVHPFEGPDTVLGTATVGAELCEQTEPVSTVIVPIGGGGLCAGVAAAVKAYWPATRVVGVEPEGADTMSRSLAAGTPVAIDQVRTIADSLGAPNAEPYTFAACRRFVDQVVRVDDATLIRAMKLLNSDLKLSVEPAGAASTAALIGPLREQGIGGSVAVILCGSNVDPHKHADWITGA